MWIFAGVPRGGGVKYSSLNVIPVSKRSPIPSMKKIASVYYSIVVKISGEKKYTQAIFKACLYRAHGPRIARSSLR